MKRDKLRINLFHAVLFFTGLMVVSCVDNRAPLGINNIYIPQATVSGGVNLNYAVPAGNGASTYNYGIDSINQKVNVYLGVLVSGQQANEGCTVDITVNKDTTNQIIAGGGILNAVLLPDSIYTLPAKVTVPQGQNSASFNLSINSIALKNYSGKNAILTVQLSNPTNYQLYTLLSKVVVVINVSSLNLP